MTKPRKQGLPFPVSETFREEATWFQSLVDDSEPDTQPAPGELDEYAHNWVHWAYDIRAQFEQDYSNIRTAMTVTPEEIAQLQAVARDLGGDT